MELTKAARKIIKHLQFYGGEIIADAMGYRMTWLTLHKNDKIKSHCRSISYRTLVSIHPYLKRDDDGDMLEDAIYILNHKGLNLE